MEQAAADRHLVAAELLGRQIGPDVKLAQLLGRRFGRRAHQQIHGLLVHRE